MGLHSKDDLLKTSKVLAEKVISYSDRCKAGEELERAEMCLALDDLADLARMLTPDLSDYDPDDMSDLHLNLKGEYFDRIKSGNKIYEFRELTPYWRKRIVGREYNNIYIKRGYPKKDDKENIIIRPWRGWKLMLIQHEHFGDEPVSVYAIRVN